MSLHSIEGVQEYLTVGTDHPQFPHVQRLVCSVWMINEQKTDPSHSLVHLLPVSIPVCGLIALNMTTDVHSAWLHS